MNSRDDVGGDEVDRLVCEFGASIGLPRWTLDARRRAALRLESGIVVALDHLNSGEIFVRLEYPLAFATPAQLMRAAQGGRLVEGTLLHVGLGGAAADQTLLAGVRLEAHAVTASQLTLAIEQMIDWCDALKHGTARSGRQERP